MPLPFQPGDCVGAWYCWWPNDPLPFLVAPAGLAIQRGANDGRVARATGMDVGAVRALRQQGHVAYLATIGGEAVGHGWVAGSTAHIGELDHLLKLAPGNRYLWGFETKPAFRNIGVYAGRLQAILRGELALRARYWIGHPPGNAASGRGILKAGFLHVGDLFLEAPGTFRLQATAPADRAPAGATVFGARLG